MNYDKIAYIVSLIKDEEFNLNNVVSFEDNFNDDVNTYRIIVRKKDELTNETTYIEYILKKNNNEIKITKNSDITQEYLLVSKDILNRHFTEVYKDSKQRAMYEFNNNLLTNDDIKVLHYDEYPDIKRSK